ncbi:acyl-CoA/acyl-ACP dehydrogenase [Nocardia sp. CDC159]|uniref:Acyl-CoA/acyl-ACP dehydrogenase n=1 Tax=Nocardia pulmonis TaxID=2951408 RepID=A0A9X2E2G2_9NOCA|nr:MULTISPECIES: acyl-CoA dehydrogenase family protein [Nocardia]MCM6772877.1 acyl-CoA/acyl-ACP dehydrogenase [Nocardia pulmonis]MCM6785820.1 acyl-CoA/acyl-ACP dehydrogenase [Nocardia sp. CDC159]
MRFALAPEQRDFATSLRKICDAAGTPALVRAWGGGDHRGGRALIRQLAGAGALGLAIAEEYGGLGAEPIDLVVAAREFGRAAVPGPLIETAAVIPALLQGIPESDSARKWLGYLAEGRALGTLALEPGLPALDADIAEVALLADGDRLYTAHRGDQVRSIDPARRLFDMVADELVAEGDSVRAALAAAFDAGALATAAQLLGAGRALLDTTVAYAKQRHQFGRPIGQYQAVKHQLANALIDLDMAEPLLFRAALTLHTPDRARDVSAAKIACADAAHRSARAALQIHGAIGYTAEYDLSLWLTKVTALRSAWGTNDFHRSRIADALRAGTGVSG